VPEAVILTGVNPADPSQGLRSRRIPIPNQCSSERVAPIASPVPARAAVRTRRQGSAEDCAAVRADGSIFAMNSKGDREILYSFTGGPDGARPVASLIMDKVGNLYGTAVIGGNLTACHDGNIHGCGTVFELSPPTSGGAWTFKVLYTFNGDANGAYPRTALTTDGAGNFYGTTSGCHSMGGSCPVYNYGTIFKITP